MSRRFPDRWSCSEESLQNGNGRLGSGFCHAALDEFELDDGFVRVVSSLKATFLRGGEGIGFANCYK